MDISLNIDVQFLYKNMADYIDLGKFDIKELQDEEKQTVFTQIEDIFHQADDLESRLYKSFEGKEIGEIHQKMNEEIIQMRKQATSIQQHLLRTSDSCSSPDQLEIVLRESLALYQKESNDKQSLENRLKKNCNDMGLRFSGSTPRNGNCFFEAVSSQLHALGLGDKTPYQLRQDVVQYLEQNKTFPGNDGPVHIEEFMSGTFENWCHEMRQNGIFADHVTVMGMARLLQTDIMIVTSSPRGGIEHNVTWINGKEDFSGTPILLGHYWENHYQSLEPKLERIEPQVVNDIAFDNAGEEMEDIDKDPFLNFIKQRYCKKPEAVGVKRIIQRMRPEEEEQNFMEIFLQKSKSNGWGNFSQCHHNKTTVQWFCERHLPPRGGKSGPLQTRANACPVYISFKFVEHNLKKATIIRTKLLHDGHNPSDGEERRVAPIHDELKAFIYSLLNQDKKNHQILLACEKWSKERGHYDFKDRQFFPTPQDIKYYAESFRSSKRYHKNDAIAVDYLCTVLLKDKIVFYQPKKESFMVDKDLKEKKAINQVFPRSAVLLCWFHVLQAIYRWLNRQESGVSGAVNAAKRKEIVNYIREMRMCTKKDDFDQLSLNIGNVMSSAVGSYINENWINIGHQWSNYGRPFFHEDHNTNNLVERFFLGMKYHFLGGYGNTRVEELILLLDGEVASLYNYMDELAKAGRLGCKIRENHGKEEAIKMLKNGYSGFLEWITDTVCLVPSTKDMTVKYKVDLIRATCECLAATNYGMCKHVHVAFGDLAQKGVILEQLRKDTAVEIINHGSYYYHDDGFLEIYDGDGNIGMVNTHSKNCLCVAYSHGIKCVCLYIADVLNESRENFNNQVEENPIYENFNQGGTDDEEESVKLEIEKKVKDIHEWANSNQVESSVHKRQILQQLNILHTTIFGSYQKNTRKRKIDPLHPYRKTIATKKKQEQKIETSDHMYCVEKQENTKKRKKETDFNRNTLPDGSFKKTNRSRNCLRKPFN